MKNIKVTINNLMEFADGIVQGANVTFTVLQAGKVLVEDSLSGKATGPYERNYEVMGSDVNVVVEHNRPDLTRLSITAAIVYPHLSNTRSKPASQSRGFFMRLARAA